MALQATTEKISPTIAIVTIDGPLTMGTNLQIVDTNLQQLVRSGTNRIILDLAGSTHADSSGLGTLVHIAGLARQHDGELRLCGVSTRIASLLTLTKTDALLPTDATRERSLQCLAGKA